MARLVYVMDPMCSWCWGFAPVVEALADQARQAGVALHLVAGGLRRESQVMDERGRARIHCHWQAVHEATGQPFDLERGLPDNLVYDTEPACRALVTARALAEDGVPRLLERIQRAFYVERRDVTRPKLLARLAEETGLDRRAFAEGFDSEAQRQATAADFAWAQNLGIAGFPTLLAERDGQYALLTNGYQPLNRLAPLLDRWLERGLRG
ncbi:MAG TPA: DsbA family protein [Pseudomonas sp.]|nr:DsbA family protein [Pseudomonas sp.]